MANLKNLIKDLSLTLVDGLLLTLLSASLAYFSLPLIYKLILAITPHEGGDIKIMGVIIFFAVGLLGMLTVLCGSFAAGAFILATLPDTLRSVARIILILLFLPLALQMFKVGPREYLYLLIHPEVRARQEKYKKDMEFQFRLKSSGALSVDRQSDGITVTNNTAKMVLVRVAFIARQGNADQFCYPQSDEEFPSGRSVAAKGSRQFLAAECVFDDYAVWGRDENGTPIYLSKRAWLP